VLFLLSLDICRTRMLNSSDALFAHRSALWHDGHCGSGISTRAASRIVGSGILTASHQEVHTSVLIAT